MNRDSFQRKTDSSGGPGAEEGRSGTAPLVSDSFERVEDLPIIQPRMRTAPLMTGSGSSAVGADVFTRQADRPGMRPQTGLLGSKPPAPGMPPSPKTDMFERQTAKKAESKPLVQQALSPGALRTLTEQTIAKALPLAESLEPRVELLLHAFKAIGIPVPGVEIGEFKHALSPNSTKIVAYLTRAMQVKPGLPRQMAVAVFRYHEAVQIVQKARVAMESDESLPPNILEELKLKFFYLANYHEEFKGDPILTQLFPAPKAGKTTGSLKKRPTTPLTAAELLRQRQAKDAAIRHAETYLTMLRPKIEQLKLIVTLQKQTNRLNNLASMVKPQERKAMGILKGLKNDERGLEQIHRALKLYEQFQASLVASKKSNDIEPLKVFIDCFHQMATAWEVHPVLKELITSKDLPAPAAESASGEDPKPTA